MRASAKTLIVEAPTSEPLVMGPHCTAIVLAGQRPGIDAVADHFGATSKSLVRVSGEAMLARVTRALLQTPAINAVMLLAQDIERQLAAPDLAWLRDNDRVIPHLSGVTISRSVLEAFAEVRSGWPVLVTTADNVFISRALVDEMLDVGGDHDLAIGFVERSRLEAACGPCSRTWLRFRDGEFTGANLFLFRSPASLQVLEFWAKVEQDRKSLWKMAARFGPLLLLLILTRRLTLAEALARAGERIGVKVRPVLLSDGRAGVDVDKVSDHMLAEKLLAADAAVEARQHG
jgi:molybdopterin-guanine dinucleotide biosynthesis protein A